MARLGQNGLTGGSVRVGAAQKPFAIGTLSGALQDERTEWLHIDEAVESRAGEWDDQ
jgi:hypothetical protein